MEGPSCVSYVLGMWCVCVSFVCLSVLVQLIILRRYILWERGWSKLFVLYLVKQHVLNASSVSSTV